MKKKSVIIIVISILIVLAAWNFLPDSSAKEEFTVKPTVGEFKLSVKTTGELRAKNSKNILGPSGLRRMGIYQLKLSKLIDEGTQVKEGDFVAQLDKSDLMSKIKDVELSLTKSESQYLQAKLDSTLTLSGARDNLENMKYSLEEKQLQKEQSIYEAPSVIRQVEIDYEKTLRGLNQAKKNYKTKVQQSIAKLTELGADLSKDKVKMAKFMEILDKFTIKAPADGMLIYAKDWNGRKKIVGSELSVWDPVVAKLPDLSLMESVTYVNEVDIRKIKKDQKVIISMDADPDKLLKGTVVSVANIGEKHKNSDSKVFEVMIVVDGKDTTLLPSMTTGNEIIIETIDKTMFIPLECLHTQNDTSYVYYKNGSGIIKKQVVTGLMNENEVVIEEGLTVEDDVLISMPEGHEEMEMVVLKNDISLDKK